jgi:hypothetical protein
MRDLCAGAVGRAPAEAAADGGRECVEVDGVPSSTVDAWFAEADYDGDGHIAGDEAKAFFARTALPTAALSRVRPCSGHVCVWAWLYGSMLLLLIACIM